MLLKPLKRCPIPSSTTAELVEPSAGTASAFILKFQEFPKKDDGNPHGHQFVALRALICLHDNGKPFLQQLVNSLHEQNPSAWPVTVLETESIRCTLDALDTEYLVRLIDYFIDNITASQLEQINDLIRDEVWPDKVDKDDAGKNS